MKTTRRPGTRSPYPWLRVLGYGGALACVAAALVVLLMPILDKDDRRDASASSGNVAGDPQAGVSPGPQAQTVAPSEPAPRQSQSGRPRQDDGGRQPGVGPTMPGDNGFPSSGTSLCPAGTAYYKSTGAAIEVTVNFQASGLVRAELSLRGGAPESKQGSAKGGRPLTFTFPGVQIAQVDRVKITAVSTGASIESCYARPGA
ncbi:hypothetical protein [Spirillospora sp. CA-294931]|uniref:hypothetical protein n=1 Tax=Spirillospora sp. CA-294931 TaxID=3240042 RepID=UPI003D917FE6